MPPIQSEEVAQRLADHMRGWRRTNGISLEMAAARAGIDLQQWHRWESGSTKNPSLKSLLLIAEVMEKDLPTLIADCYWPAVDQPD